MKLQKIFYLQVVLVCFIQLCVSLLVAIYGLLATPFSGLAFMLNASFQLSFSFKIKNSAMAFNEKQI